jgi:hypothetical protein
MPRLVNYICENMHAYNKQKRLKKLLAYMKFDRRQHNLPTSFKENPNNLPVNGR